MIGWYSIFIVYNEPIYWIVALNHTLYNLNFTNKLRVIADEEYPSSKFTVWKSFLTFRELAVCKISMAWSGALNLQGNAFKLDNESKLIKIYQTSILGKSIHSPRSFALVHQPLYLRQSPSHLLCDCRPLEILAKLCIDQGVASPGIILPSHLTLFRLTFENCENDWWAEKAPPPTSSYHTIRGCSSIM